MSTITILSFYDRIALFHSLTPFLEPAYRKMFHFTNSPEYCLKKDKNKILIMVRQFLKPDRVDHDFLKKARQKYDKIAFFNGNAGGGIPRLEVLPYVDLFYSKALFKDKSLYGKQLYGGELYTDYFHTNQGINDEEDRIRAVEKDPLELAKLRLSWNIGIGEFPRRKWIQRAGVYSARKLNIEASRPFRLKKGYTWPESNRKDIDIHARILMTDKSTIARQRQIILDTINDRPEFLTGSVGQKEYNREIGRSKITLSPFGWGELCIRDFEAVLGRSLLMKPEMEHLETWPDIFQKDETYIPLAWDCHDLLEKTKYYINHDKERNKIIEQALTLYREQIEELPLRFEKILEEITQ